MGRLHKTGLGINSRHKPSFTFNVETLETRVMLAGDIFVSLSNAGDLRVVGDNADNQVEISQSNSAIQFTGIADTTIHFGGSSGTGIAIPIDDSIRDLRIDLKGNSDTIVINDVVVGRDINAKMAEGNDGIHISGAEVTRHVKVDAGRDAGDDTVSLINTTVGGNFDVKLGHATNTDAAFAGDRVDVLNSEVDGNVKLDGKDGNHSFTFDGNTIGKNTTLNMGNGNDSLLISNNTIGGRFNSNTGNGNDTIYARGTFNSSVNIKTGNGVDQIGIDNSTIASTLVLNTGNDADFVQFDSSVLHGRLAVQLGSGSDTINFDLVTMALNELTGTINGSRDGGTVDLADQLVPSRLRLVSIDIAGT